MSTIKLIVATHKEYEMPLEGMYLPVFVGSALSTMSLPYQRDDEGANISEKNKTYCELTGLYWAYKNLKSDYLGLCHYRRYFKYRNSLLDEATALRLLDKCPIILPKKRHYYIETVYSQYVHAHGKQSIDTCRNVLAEDFPQYLDAFDLCMNRRSLHIYNMFIMRRDILEDYCTFLFAVLFKIEKQLMASPRIMGFLSERLLDVYLQANKFSYQELSVLNKEKINWTKKIVGFLRRKISKQEPLK